MHISNTHSVCVSVSILQYESSGLGLISSRLRTTLNRIQESLIDMVRLRLALPLSPSLLFTLLPACIISLSVSFSDTNTPSHASVLPSLCTSFLLMSLLSLFGHPFCPY